MHPPRYSSTIARVALAAVLVAAALAAVAAGSASTRAAKTITFGMEASLSGADAAFGTANRDGANLAVQEINNRGGVVGSKIKLQAEDNEGKPEAAVNICTK